MIMGSLGSAPLPAVIPYVVAGRSCIDRPIPSNFLSDKGQKSNDKVADLLPWEQRQAGGAPEIRGGWAPTLFPALESGGWGGWGLLGYSFRTSVWPLPKI